MSKGVDSPSFCVLPWVHAATFTDGTGLLCCIAKAEPGLNLNDMSLGELRNSDHFKDARLKMMNGERPAACSHCWKEEDAGIKSHRQHELGVWKEDIGWDTIKKLVDDTHEDGTIDNDVYHVDFRLGNTCNLACVMCRPTDSSKWYREATMLSKNLKGAAKYDWIGKKDVNRESFEWYTDPDFLEDFYSQAGSLRQMIFAGGEPLLIKEQKQIVKELINRGYAKNIRINYHTNGTIYDPEMIELWKEFKRVDLFFSFDGTPRINKYVRYPALHETVEKNLKKFNDNASPNVHFRILSTIQALNIYYIPEFIEYIVGLGLPRIAREYDEQMFRDWGDIVHFGILHFPEYLSPQMLPGRIKRQITRKLVNFRDDNKDKYKLETIDGLLELMNSTNKNHLQPAFVEYIDEIDKMRKLDSKTTFHELDKLGLFNASRNS